MTSMTPPEMVNFLMSAIEQLMKMPPEQKVIMTSAGIKVEKERTQLTPEEDAKLFGDESAEEARMVAQDAIILGDDD